MSSHLRRMAPERARKLSACGLAAALAIALVPALGGCSTQTPSVPQHPSGSASTEAAASASASSSAAGSIAPKASESVFAMKSMRLVYADAEGTGEDETVVIDYELDEKGSVVSMKQTEHGGETEYLEKLEVDENGFPTHAETVTSDEGYDNTGDVGITASEDGTTLTLSYASGRQVAYGIDGNTAHVRREVETESGTEAGTLLKKEAVYDEQGYISRIDYYYDIVTARYTYTWEFDGKGHPTVCRVLSVAQSTTGNSAPYPNEDPEEFTVECDDDGNITAFVNAEGAVVGSYEYEYVKEPSIAAIIASSEKPIPH